VPTEAALKLFVVEAKAIWPTKLYLTGIIVTSSSSSKSQRPLQPTRLIIETISKNAKVNEKNFFTSKSSRKNFE
jgi:hypothetical protein